MKFRFALQGLAALGTCFSFAGCGPGEDCRPIDAYAVSVRVDGVGTASCEVNLEGATKTAVYRVPEPCAETDSAVAEASGGSPLPSSAASGHCAIYILFVADAAHNLIEYVGSDSVPVTVTCDGKLVVTGKLTKRDMKECGS